MKIRGNDWGWTCEPDEELVKLVFEEQQHKVRKAKAEADLAELRLKAEVAWKSLGIQV